ncbi:TolC family protein [bacterium]|nr:TolC family protein [bacterium]
MDYRAPGVIRPASAFALMLAALLVVMLPAAAVSADPDADTASVSVASEVPAVQPDMDELERLLGELTPDNRMLDQLRHSSDPRDILLELASEYEQPLPQLTLGEALDLAIVNNHALNSTRLTAQAACQNVEVNWTALRPQIGLSGSTFWQFDNAEKNTNTQNNSSSTEGKNIRSLALGITQRIYDFGLTRDLVDSAETRHAIQVQSVDMTEQQLVQSVVESYWDFNLALGEVKIRKNEVELSEEFLRQSRARYDAGTVPRLDVIRSEARVEEARQALVTSRAQLGNVATRFHALLGVNDAQYVPTLATADMLLPGMPAGDLEEYIVSALETRPEIKLQYASLFSKDLERSLAENRPIIEAFGNAAYQEPNSFGGSMNYQVGVRLNWTLHDGGRSRIEQEVIDTEFAAISQDILELETQVQADVTISWNRLMAAQQSLGVAEKNLELSREGLLSAAVGYAAGVVPFIDYQDALDNSVAAALLYLSTIAEIRKAWVNLERSQGFPSGYPGDSRALIEQSGSVESIQGL